MSDQVEAPPVIVVGAGRCAKCGYDAGGFQSAACPECGAISSAKCRGCGYELAGLPFNGVCPECSMPVRRSLSGNLLVNSGKEYIASLHRGVTLVVAGILIELLLMLVMIFASVAMVAGGGGGNWVELLSTILTFGTTVVVLVGWWMFSEPDPAVVAGETGSRARQILRIAVIASAVLALIDLLAEIGGFILAPNAGFWAFLILTTVFGLAVTAVKYFAAMQYLRWLAPRIPDADMERTATRYLWLLPILATIGIILVGLGPLIALILYVILLDQVRRRLKGIRAEQDFASVVQAA